MIDDAEYARRIRMARAYLGLTLAEAGEHLGISASQLSTRERADRNGMRLRPPDRLYMGTIYARLTGWPIEVFTEEEIPPLAPPGRHGDDLDPAEVVDLIEQDRDDDGGAVERG